MVDVSLSDQVHVTTRSKRYPYLGGGGGGGGGSFLEVSDEPRTSMLKGLSEKYDMNEFEKFKFKFS